VSEKLKPCPFCGGEAKLVWSGGFRYAECTECGISGNDAGSFGLETGEQIDKAAAEKWNTRADIPPPSAGGKP
jgi:Lar family restriction alleviation protein